jgi:acid stress chaperone HdeB
MKAFAVAFAATVVAWSLPGEAADIDLSSWTCRQFQSVSKDDLAVIVAWLDGYYKDEDDPAVIDTTQFAANAKKLGDYCAAHPDIGFITATDKLFQKE